MAKDSASSRIPRLDGVSRIPLPGSVRPHSSAIATAGVTARPSQFLQRTSSVAFPQKRPSTLAGLRPTIGSASSLKHSSSGDHITNAMNLVTKKTTTALKKLMGKPDKTVTEAKIKRKQPLQPNPSTSENTFVTSPRPLTRSDTFVRMDSPVNITQFSPNALTQSTPAPSTGASLTTTRIVRQPDINETTTLLNGNTRQLLYTSQSLDVTQLNPAAQLGETFQACMKQTITFDESPKDMTISLNTHQTSNIAPTILKPNFTATFSVPALLGQTLNVASPMEVYTANSQKRFDSTLRQDSKSSLSSTRIVDSSEAASPMTNATYSNPDSLDNLQLLEDVSAPSGLLEMDMTLQPDNAMEHDKTRDNLLDCSISPERNDLNSTIKPVAPDKAHLKLPLNSTVNTERLLDLTATMLSTSQQQIHMLNLTNDYLESAHSSPENTSQLLYITQHQYASSERNTPDYNPNLKFQEQTNLLTPPQRLKGAHSDLMLPTRSPDDEPLSVPMSADSSTLLAMGSRTEEFFARRGGRQRCSVSIATSLQDVNKPNAKQKSRSSFGLDLTESTLDCSIELVDVSLSSNAAAQSNTNSTLAVHPASTSLLSQPMQQQSLRRQISFELDESLGILTPDQMKEFLDSTNTNNTNNMELALMNTGNKMALHHLRIDQTPSPEELPLDPIEIKTDVSDLLLTQQHQQTNMFDSSAIMLQHQQQLHQSQQQLQQQQFQSSSISTTEPVSTHTDTDLSSKTSDVMTKSNVSKISTSFITSVTSVTSLDTGYQGDGEMSRPASRGACDHSPSNGPATRKGGHVSRQPSFNQQLQQQQMPFVRRQDPMTDSDFFTESDADDIFHRGDRRAQVIDGQLYGPMLQPTASVFISEDPEDSCMESSGIFTDVENRCDDDLAQMRRQDTQDAMLDLSPEGDGDDSTETVKSNRDTSKNAINSEREVNKTEIIPAGDTTVITMVRNVAGTTLGQGQLSNSQTSSTIHSSVSTDRLSAATLSNRTSYCSVDGSTVNVDGKSFSSLEEAFDESSPALGTAGIISSTTLTSASARRARLSTTGNISCDAASHTGKSGDDGKVGVEALQRASVLRVTSPRKHSSLTSLSTAGVNGVAFGSAKIDNSGNGFRLSPSRGRIVVERETHSESGTASTKVACASSSSSTTSLSLHNHCNNHKNTKLIALEAVIAAAGNRCSPRTKCASERNSPKQHASTGSVASVGDIGATPLNVRKKQAPKKWEAVMSKIEVNKALPKKNYNQVKSKVSTIRSNGVGVAGGAGGGATSGVSGRGSVTQTRLNVLATPLIRRSATSNAVNGSSHSRGSLTLLPLRPTDNGAQRSGSGSPNATQQVSKRLFQSNATKRGRSYSKDSQKSSQSDLSMASARGGSPKLLAKTPLRAAKKRDVRNLSISPTDLGPPPKTQQTVKSTTARFKPAVISLGQKRYPTQSISGTPSATSTAVSTPTGNGGGSIKLKTPPVVKKIVKDQNRSIGNSAAKNAKHTVTPTELHQMHHNNNNNNSITTTRTNSQTPSPILGHHGKKPTTAATNVATATAVGVAVGGTLFEKKTQSKLLSTRSKTLLQKSHQQQRSAEEAPALAGTERLDATELQHLKYLNRHSCNGRLDYEAIERHLEQTELQEQQRNKSIEVLGVLLQYTVNDLDAFACPTLKADKVKIQNCLAKTLQLLNETKSACSQLQDQLGEKECYYTQREEELQALHRCEMEKAQASLSDYQAFAQDKFAALESQLDARTEEQKRTLDSYHLEMDNKLSQKQQQLEAAEQREFELKQRFSALELSEQELRIKITNTEHTYAARLHAAAERENELNDRIRELTKELDALHATKQNRERELRDKLNLSQDEIAVLRSSQRSFNESLERSSISSPRNSSTSELARLQSEVDSLHCVLELKQKEISKLTKHNEELLRDASERAVLQGKISLLESNNEMLRSELEIKSEKEKDFLRQIDDIQKTYNHEMVKRKRLTYDNEALQWQLKQRSEQLHIVETKLHELSAQEAFNTSTLSSLSSLNRSQMVNGSSLINIQMDDISPPTSPVVKGVIEKPDSVSWVLEMDDETPEAAASKMVKRAGSFRSAERSPSTRRQLTACASATTSLNCVGSVGNTNGTAGGPNPLSQSMSATSVIRQHSSEARPEFNNRTHPRIRSKSVSVKGTEPTLVGTGALNTGSVGTKSGKKIMRQTSGSNARKQHQLELINWKEPISSSSPHMDAMRTRTSTLRSDVAEELNSAAGDSPFQRTPITNTAAARKLITCDTSKLNSGERLDLQSLPSHASVHDIKVLKKSQEIQESAGEAMVSGTNSEDEGCSASSDEIVCSASTSSATTGSTSSLKNSHMSLEEVLLLDKINSLNGTPMEVSWSDDAEVFVHGSTV